VNRVASPSALRWFILAAGVLAADQASKWGVQALLLPGERVVLTSFFNLVLVFNTGAAFSFLASASGWQTPFFATIAVAAALIVSVLLLRAPAKRLLCTGYALILGGALGNLIDRLIRGKVVDFVDLHAFGWHWPAFNVADSAILVGAGLLILESFTQPANEGRDARR